MATQSTPDNTKPPSLPATAGVQQRITKRFAALSLLLLVVTLLAAAAPLAWWLELFSHFTLFYALAALLCTVVLALLGAWRWLLLALALTLWHGFPLAQALFFKSAPAASAKNSGRLTVFHFNVGVGNEQSQRVLSYLQRRAKEIDVIALFEANNDFDYVLDELKDVYPYQIKHLEDTPFGIALVSKHPIDYGAVAFIPSEHFPHIEATLKLPGRGTPLALYAIHPPPPISGELAKARNAQLDHVARAVAKQAKATPIVVGDFNLTPWSPYFKRFLTVSGLRDARTPRRFDHTWPVTFNNAHLGLAIDHSLAHPSLRLVKRTIGPDLGSDHLPVTVTFGY